MCSVFVKVITSVYRRFCPEFIERFSDGLAEETAIVKKFHRVKLISVILLRQSLRVLQRFGNKFSMFKQFCKDYLCFLQLKIMQ